MIINKNHKTILFELKKSFLTSLKKITIQTGITCKRGILSLNIKEHSKAKIIGAYNIATSNW